MGPERRLRIGYLSGARIVHRGYVAEVFDAKEQGRTAISPWPGLRSMTMTLGRPYALMNYGRALESAGRSAEAIEALREAVALTSDPIIGRLALQNLIYIFGRLGRFEDALDQVGELRTDLGQPDRRRHRRRPAPDLHGRRHVRPGPPGPGAAAGT